MIHSQGFLFEAGHGQLQQMAQQKYVSPVIAFYVHLL